jgi:hypothetical protein
VIFIPKYTGRCDTCGRDVPREQIVPADFEQLEAEYHYAAFSDELKWLRRVEAFYQRHPEAVGNVKPHAMRVLEAKHEPSIMRKLFAGMPLSEIAVPPPTRPPVAPPISAEDAEVIDYLEHNSFDLDNRMQFVTEQVARYARPPRPVTCPVCAIGALSLVIANRR